MHVRLTASIPYLAVVIFSLKTVQFSSRTIPLVMQQVVFQFKMGEYIVIIYKGILSVGIT